jgi:hypothetical protein
MALANAAGMYQVVQHWPVALDILRQPFRRIEGDMIGVTRVVLRTSRILSGKFSFQVLL